MIANIKSLSFQVLTECKNLLLKITSPDALTRLRFTNLKENIQEELNSIYYDQQCHHSIDALLVNLITTADILADILADGLLIQVIVTTGVLHFLVQYLTCHPCHKNA